VEDVPFGNEGVTGAGTHAVSVVAPLNRRCAMPVATWIVTRAWSLGIPRLGPAQLVRRHASAAVTHSEPANAEITSAAGGGGCGWGTRG
jgi:hypothetical protein